jgi:alkanesulfonate monooxygenase SsuD/methylene tetrahydromethanopterin reductase-like flavin-dependent oxidoreductase (luciferase family)
VRIGVLMLPTDPWPETVARARQLEDLGYHHIWTYDHLSWRRYRERDWHAAIPWLTGIAAATSRIRVGTMVSSPNFRHPVTLAKDAMTLDHVSGGRLTLGIGAGGIGFDATVLGGEVLPPGVRARRLGEFVEVVGGLLATPRFSYTGGFYTVDDARMIPGCVQRPRLPVAVAAGGRRTLETVARHADAWITEGPLPAVREQAALLDEHCARLDRAVPRRIYLADEDERPLASVDAFVDYVGRLRAMGFTELVFHDPRPDDPVWTDDPAMVERIGALLTAGAVGG